MHFNTATENLAERPSFPLSNGVGDFNSIYWWKRQAMTSTSFIVRELFTLRIDGRDCSASSANSVRELPPEPVSLYIAFEPKR